MARPDWHDSRTPEVVVAEAPARATPQPPEPGPSDQLGTLRPTTRRLDGSIEDDIDVAAAEPGPNNSWNATVRQEDKFEQDELRPDGAQRDPASPGVGPLPTYLFGIIVLLVIVAAIYAIAQVLV
jgi:hypothetical protein